MIFLGPLNLLQTIKYVGIRYVHIEFKFPYRVRSRWSYLQKLDGIHNLNLLYNSEIALQMYADTDKVNTKR